MQEELNLSESTVEGYIGKLKEYKSILILWNYKISKIAVLKQKLLLRKLDFKYIFSYKANNNIRSYDIGKFSVNKYQRTNLKW